LRRVRMNNCFRAFGKGCTPELGEH
jgi:hypothetical protein